MTINDTLEKYGRTARLGIIDLGWENGWGKDTEDLYEELRQFWIDNTYTRSGRASSQTMSVKVKKDDEEYQLRWYLDSGD
jgi:hypothetical protein